MKHKKTIEKYDWSLHELWEDIGDLDYDALVDLFDILTKKFKKDSLHDLELNHPEVSERLMNISKALAEVLKKEMKPLANICRGYNQKGIK